MNLDVTPGKVVSTPPGNAFAVIYDGIQEKVLASVHALDPVLGVWIQNHLYGDIFSSPGLTLRQKEYMMVAFLSEAHMPRQLFGHARAALRLGASPASLARAAKLGFEYAPRVERPVVREAMETIQGAVARVVREQGERRGGGGGGGRSGPGSGSGRMRGRPDAGWERNHEQQLVVDPRSVLVPGLPAALPKVAPVVVVVGGGGGEGVDKYKAGCSSSPGGEGVRGTYGDAVHPMATAGRQQHMEHMEHMEWMEQMDVEGGYEEERRQSSVASKLCGDGCGAGGVIEVVASPRIRA